MLLIRRPHADPVAARGEVHHVVVGVPVRTALVLVEHVVVVVADRDVVPGEDRADGRAVLGVVGLAAVGVDRAAVIEGVHHVVDVVVGDLVAAGVVGAVLAVGQALRGLHAAG